MSKKGDLCERPFCQIRWTWQVHRYHDHWRRGWHLYACDEHAADYPTDKTRRPLSTPSAGPRSSGSTTRRPGSTRRLQVARIVGAAVLAAHDVVNGGRFRAAVLAAPAVATEDRPAQRAPGPTVGVDERGSRPRRRPGEPPRCASMRRSWAGAHTRPRYGCIRLGRHGRMSASRTICNKSDARVRTRIPDTTRRAVST